MTADIRVPVWLMTLLVSAFLGVIAWGAVDRLQLESERGEVKEWIKQVDRRLERIERVMEQYVDSRGTKR